MILLFLVIKVIRKEGNMKKKSSQKPEDILIEENFSKSTLNEKNTEIDKNNFLIVSQIYSFLTSAQNIFPEYDKEQTKKRIKTSVRKHQWKRHLVRVSAAAAILFICILTGIWYSQLNHTSEIDTFAQSMRNLVPEEDTRLILVDGNEVRIEKQESEISYAQNGKKISIGKDQKITQSIASQEQSFNTVIVPYGKRTLITLSDGTKVWLNSGTKLIYPSIFAKNKREVYIEGEGIFEVTHSDMNPFYVKTRDFDVKVLGTVFNICAYADDKNSSTILERGKVELNYKAKGILAREKFTISPGTMAEFDPYKNVFTQKIVNPQDYMSWKNGYMNFNSEKLVNILKKINRYYNVEVLLQGNSLQDETFSGSLDLKNTPEEVLDVIAHTILINYVYEDNKIIITSKPNSQSKD